MKAHPNIRPTGPTAWRMSAAHRQLGPHACSRPGSALRAVFLQSRTRRRFILHAGVGTSWGLRLGSPWHGVAATGTNWLVRYHNTLVTREPDHLAKVRVAGSNPVVRSGKRAGQRTLSWRGCKLRNRHVPYMCHICATGPVVYGTTGTSVGPARQASPRRRSVARPGPSAP